MKIGEYTIGLDEKRHQLYFSLAKAYYKKGNLEQSEINMKRAKRYAKEGELASRYQGKIEFLNQSQ